MFLLKVLSIKFSKMEKEGDRVLGSWKEELIQNMDFPTLSFFTYTGSTPKINNTVAEGKHCWKRNREITVSTSWLGMLGHVRFKKCHDQPWAWHTEPCKGAMHMLGH